MFRICHFAREDNSSSFAMSIFMATYLITIKELHWQHIHFHIKKKKLQSWTSLMVLWLRIHLLMHGTQVRSLTQGPYATPQLPSWHSRARELQQLKLMCPTACAPQQEKSLQWEAHTTVKSSPHLLKLEKPMPSNKTQCNQKINYFLKNMESFYFIM